MASRKKSEKQELQKCGECKNNVTNTEKAVQCELCELWFHCKGEEIQEDTYELLKQDKIHFFCGKCEKAAGQLLKSVVKLKERQDKLEEDLITFKKEISTTIQDFADTFTEEAKSKTEDIAKLGKTVDDMKKEVGRFKLEYKTEFKKMNDQIKDVIKAQEEADYKKQIEQITQAFVKDTQWTDIVKKEVNSKIENVTAELSSIQKMVDVTKSMAEEEKEKEARSNNIIIYRVPESTDTSFEGRQKHDKATIIDILRELIDKDLDETEIQKTFRLGKMNIDASKQRPILVQFVNRMTKNYLMNNLYYIKKTHYKDIVISHDMTKNERDQCKKLVEEAKKKELEESSGEWIFRVRGLPGQMKIMKIRKRN
jgi:hypothetical protein